MIDIRSDTVTRPTPAMLQAMMAAQVGDDVFGEDATVNALQERAARLFGMEAALYCPSGTMTNQIAIKIHTQPGDEVICDELAHVYLYEGGGIAFNSGASVRTLRGNNGRFTADQVEENINGRENAHFPCSQLVTVENTVNKGGGCCWDLAEIERIRDVCNRHGLALHLDGARLFNALVARGQTPQRYGELFDTISVCLSKGLGAPVGSLLLGSKAHIVKAHRVRKVLGGGMRQAGFLAAAGLYAIEHHTQRLSQDHDKARVTGETLQTLPYVATVLPVETNIVVFRLGEAVGTAAFLQHLREHQVLAFAIGKQTVRFVFHLDVSDEHFGQLLTALQAFRPAAP